MNALIILVLLLTPGAIFFRGLLGALALHAPRDTMMNLTVDKKYFTNYFFQELPEAMSDPCICKRVSQNKGQIDALSLQ